MNDELPSGVVSESRLKKHIIGPSHTISLVCPPGFEDLSLKEARSIGLPIDPETQSGSVIEFEGRIDDIYKANLGLRTVSRVRVKVAEFRAGAREELFRKAMAVPWELWLPSGDHAVRAHVSYSLISNEGIAAATLSDAVHRKLREAGVVPDLNGGSLAAPVAAVEILLRIEENRARISIDTSGEHLHKRGWRLYGGLAPLRESLAAGILMAAGWPSEYDVLVDGMCGSGTVPLEAASMASGEWAGKHRSFAFERMPWHKPRRFEWLRAHPPSDVRGTPVRIFGNERNEAVLQGALSNAGRLTALAEYARAIEWNAGDFFSLAPGSLFEIPAGTNVDFLSLPPNTVPRKRVLVFLNPPYGKRISAGERGLFSRVADHLLASWNGARFAVLVPEGAGLGALEASVTGRRSFRHGGLRVELCTGTIVPRFF